LKSGAALEMYTFKNGAALLMCLLEKAAAGKGLKNNYFKY